MKSVKVKIEIVHKGDKMFVPLWQIADMLRANERKLACDFGLPLLVELSDAIKALDLLKHFYLSVREVKASRELGGNNQRAPAQ